MKKRNTIILSWLISVILLSCAGRAVAAAVAAAAQQQDTIWMYCYVDVGAKVPQKGREDKREGRYYVTELISMSVKQYKKINPNSNSTEYFEKACVDYFDKTVVKAAESRGVQITYSGLSGLITNIDGPDVNSNSGYHLTSKEDLAKDRAERIESNQGTNRKTCIFSWDPMGKNVDADLQREMNRTEPTSRINDNLSVPQYKNTGQADDAVKELISSFITSSAAGGNLSFYGRAEKICQHNKFIPG